MSDLMLHLLSRTQEHWTFEDIAHPDYLALAEACERFHRLSSESEPPSERMRSAICQALVDALAYRLPLDPDQQAQAVLIDLEAEGPSVAEDLDYTLCVEQLATGAFCDDAEGLLDRLLGPEQRETLGLVALEALHRHMRPPSLSMREKVFAGARPNAAYEDETGKFHGRDPFLALMLAYYAELPEARSLAVDFMETDNAGLFLDQVPHAFARAYLHEEAVLAWCKAMSKNDERAGVRQKHRYALRERRRLTAASTEGA